MSSLPQLGRDRWPGVTDPRPPVDEGGPAKARRRWVWALTSVAALAVVGLLLVWLRSPHPASLEGYLVPTSTSSLTVVVLTGSGDVVTGARVREKGDQVQVTVTVRSPRGSRTSVGIPVSVPLALTQPLGGRTVVDAHSGKSLAQLEREP